jgi:branched-chain amino acid transport system permease protein
MTPESQEPTSGAPDPTKVRSTTGVATWEAAFIALLTVGIVVYPLIASDNVFMVRLVGVTFSYAIFALSINIMLGWAGEIPLGHGVFFGGGAYFCAYLMRDHDITFVVAVAIAIAVACLLALLIGLITLRLTGAYFSIVSWGLAGVAVIAANNLTELTGGALGFYGIPTATVGPWTLADPQTYAWVTGATLLIVLAVLWRVRSTRFGVTLNGTRLNERLGTSLGIHAYRERVKAFVFSAGLAALAGAFYITYASIITPDSMSVFVTVEALLMALIGGTGYLVGPVVGAVFFKIVPERLALEADVRQIVFAVLIIFVVLLAPGGLPHVVRRAAGRFKRRRGGVDGEGVSRSTSTRPDEDVSPSAAVNDGSPGSSVSSSEIQEASHG